MDDRSVSDLKIVYDVLRQMVEKNSDNAAGTVIGLLVQLMEDTFEREGVKYMVDALEDVRKGAVEMHEQTKERMKGMSDEEQAKSLAMIYMLYRKVQDRRQDE